MLAPSGEIIEDVPIKHSEDNVKILVHTIKPISLKEPENPPRRDTRRVRGHIIERNGKALPANLQVLIFASKKSEKTTMTVGVDSPAILVRADKPGYFFGDTPNECFKSAAALVARLEEEIQIVLEDGYIPAHILLFIDYLSKSSDTQSVKNDCSCDKLANPPRKPSHLDIENSPETYSVDQGTGGCVQFNTPNRAIEEFDFYTIVRTTMPGIRSHTLGNVSRRVTPPALSTGSADLAPLKQLRKSL